MLGNALMTKNGFIAHKNAALKSLGKYDDPIPFLSDAVG
jgi:hypothetical protein